MGNIAQHFTKLKEKINFDNEQAELEEDPQKLKIEFKEELDKNMNSLTLSVQGSVENCKNYQLLD